MFEAVCKLGLEGIVSKKLNSPYKSGPSKAWLKIKKSESAGSDPCSRWHILRSMTQSLFLYRHAKAVVRIIGTRTTTMCDSGTRAEQSSAALSATRTHLRTSRGFGRSPRGSNRPRCIITATQRAANRRCDILRRGGRRHSGRYSLSSRPKPSHGSSTASSLRLINLSLRLRLRPGQLPTSHRNPRSHHHSHTYLRT